MSASAMSRDELVAQLTKHRNFAGLTRNDLDILLDVATLRQFDADEVLFEVDEPLTSGYILINGRIELAEEPYPGRKLHRQAFAPGTLFGVGGFIKDWPSRRRCVACEESAALTIDRGAFLRQIDAGHVAAFRIVDALLDLYVKEVQNVNQQLDEIFNRPGETLALLRKQAGAAEG